MSNHYEWGEAHEAISDSRSRKGTPRTSAQRRGRGHQGLRVGSGQGMATASPCRAAAASYWTTCSAPTNTSPTKPADRPSSAPLWAGCASCAPNAPMFSSATATPATACRRSGAWTKPRWICSTTSLKRPPPSTTTSPPRPVTSERKPVDGHDTRTVERWCGSTVEPVRCLKKRAKIDIRNGVKWITYPNIINGADVIVEMPLNAPTKSCHEDRHDHCPHRLGAPQEGGVCSK